MNTAAEGGELFIIGRPDGHEFVQGQPNAWTVHSWLATQYARREATKVAENVDGKSVILPVSDFWWSL